MGDGVHDSRQADIPGLFCTNKVNVLPFVNAKLLWMSSLNSSKHFQGNCSLTGQRFNT